MTVLYALRCEESPIKVRKKKWNNNDESKEENEKNDKNKI